MKHLITITGLAVVLLFTLGINQQALAQSKIDTPDIEVGVDGLTCPFCTYGLEKKFKKVKAVEAVVIDLKEGKAKLTLAAGKTLSEEEIKKTVDDAGFEVRSITYLNKSARPEKVATVD